MRPRALACSETFAGSLTHEGVFELGDSTKDLEEHSSHSSGGIDALVEDDKIDAFGFQPFRQSDEVFQGPAQPVELGNHDLITGTGRKEGFAEFGSFGEFAGRFVGEDAFAAGHM